MEGPNLSFPHVLPAAAIENPESQISAHTAFSGSRHSSGLKNKIALIRPEMMPAVPDHRDALSIIFVRTSLNFIFHPGHL
jgi:hypothetical protein